MVFLSKRVSMIAVTSHKRKRSLPATCQDANQMVTLRDIAASLPNGESVALAVIDRVAVLA
jgi:hypothetical protein